jgi:signal transduction histidine kinase
MSQSCQTLRTLLIGVGVLVAASLRVASAETPGDATVPSVTRIGQFRGIPASAFLSGVAMRLTGVVTMLDTNRNLLALQDESGGVGIHVAAAGMRTISIGERIEIEASNCSPYAAQFPDFPFSPTGRDARPRFEAPTNWGDYHLQRMRGWLRPPVSGAYSFWIASDNSSELWLSSDASPANVKRIALIERSSWVKPREWARYRSQHSDLIPLEGGHAYYIEAVQEQLLEDDNLAVAWEGPTLSQSVIDGAYLTPWGEGPEAATNGGPGGILREYWTNYADGTVEGVTGPRPFESVITPENPTITVLGKGEMPAPVTESLAQPLNPNDNFCWASIEGTMAFAGNGGGQGLLELIDGVSSAQVNVAQCDRASLLRLQSSRVRAEGVCEGIRDRNGDLRLALVWAPSLASVAPVETMPTNVEMAAAPTSAESRPFGAGVSMGSFYWTRGMITFNDRVFGSNYLIVQEPAAAVFISPSQRTENLRVGELVEMGGALNQGGPAPELNPMVIHRRGLAPMPIPSDVPAKAADNSPPDGLWTELEGIVHAVNPDGTLSLMGRTGEFDLWADDVARNSLPGLVDARLRVRGCLLLSARKRPLLLIPTARFIEVMDPPSGNAFAAPLRNIADIGVDRTAPIFGHRLRITASVTYQDGRILFAQDATGAMRVQLAQPVAAGLDKPVIIAGFPDATGLTPTLTGAQVEPSHVIQTPKPAVIEPSDAITLRRDAELVTLSGTLIDEKQGFNGAALELQSGPRLFEARLTQDRGRLPTFATGSILRLTGVCNFTAADALAPAVAPGLSAGAGFALLLRSPADVALILVLTMVLCGAILWIRLLRRRLQRQQAAQLAFSRQILHGQESERRRIAANLHDSLGQNLLVIKNQVCLAMQSGAGEGVLRKRLDEISGVTSQAIEEVRQITLGLRPYHLDRLGLTQAIRAAVNLVAENSSILFATNVDPVDALFDAESEIHVYRIVQESINNIVKHSGASEATVVVRRNGPSLALSIRDNGRGFEATSNGAANGSGYGLGGMTERVRILGGSLAIDSPVGHGTAINVQIPLPANHHA